MTKGRFLNAPNAQRQIARNVAVHDRVARRYDAIHGEIFNDIEQARLRESLILAISAVRSERPVEALDFGCGSGNLTRHLLALGARVTAADVSTGCLDLVRSRHECDALDTHLMENGSLASIPDERFDLIATYSVLHHIPDYLTACSELARICRKGGVVMIDHESNEEFWTGNRGYRQFRKEALRFDWRKYLTPSNYFHRVRRLFNPRHSNEGDIHVWPDDHIEWARIKALMERSGFEVVHEQDYLLYRKLYRREVYDRYVGRCTDTKLMIFRKCAA